MRSIIHHTCATDGYIRPSVRTSSGQACIPAGSLGQDPPPTIVASLIAVVLSQFQTALTVKPRLDAFQILLHQFLLQLAGLAQLLRHLAHCRAQIKPAPSFVHSR